MQPKLFLGPVSKNTVDAAISFSNENSIPLGLIPSRRQIDTFGGYVNTLDFNNTCTTKAFSYYVRSKSKNILLVRDHGGPGQGEIDDDGRESFENDCYFFDVIHIDPWKKYINYSSGLQETIDLINKGSLLNPFISFEIGTEEAIRKFSVEELEKLILDLKSKLRPKIFNKIKYLVIQSGTALKGNTNTGTYSSQQLKDMIALSKKYGFISKEHNGDYLASKLIKQKFKLGLDCINIAPEFGKIESEILAKKFKAVGEGYFMQFFKICKDSKKWVKWVDKSFNPDDNVLETILISGHYVFSHPSFLLLKQILGSGVNIEVQNSIKKRIQSIIK